MSESANALGLPIVVECNGQEFRFAPMDNLEVIANYECWLEKQAWEALNRAKKYLSDDDYKEQSEGIRHDLISGACAFGGKVYNQSMNALENQRHLLWLMARFYDKEIEKTDIDKFMRSPGKVNELLKRMDGGADPKAQDEMKAATT